MKQGHIVQQFGFLFLSIAQLCIHWLELVYIIIVIRRMYIEILVNFSVSPADIKC